MSGKEWIMGEDPLLTEEKFPGSNVQKYIRSKVLYLSSDFMLYILIRNLVFLFVFIT